MRAAPRTDLAAATASSSAATGTLAVPVEVGVGLGDRDLRMSYVVRMYGIAARASSSVKKKWFPR